MSYVKLVGARVSDGSMAEVKLTDSNSLYVTNKVIISGTQGNVLNNEALFAIDASTAAIDISGYNYITVLWKDSSTGNFGNIYILQSIDGTNWYEAGLGTTTQISRSTGTTDPSNMYGKATGSVYGVKYIKFYNDSGSSFSNVTCTLVGRA